MLTRRKLQASPSRPLQCIDADGMSEEARSAAMDQLVSWVRELPRRWARTSAYLGALVGLSHFVSFGQREDLWASPLHVVALQVVVMSASFAIVGFGLGWVARGTAPSPAEDAGERLERRLVTTWMIGGAILASSALAIRSLFGLSEWPTTVVCLAWVITGAVMGMEAGKYSQVALRILRTLAVAASAER